MFKDMHLGRIHRDVPANAPRLEAHAIAGMAAPSKLDRSKTPYQPIMGGNNFCGCCTWVGVANAIKAQAALGGFDVAIPDSAPEAAYSAMTGYPKQDPGLSEIDVLARQVTDGFDTGGQTPYAGLWASMDPQDLNGMRAVMARLGVSYLAVALAEADKTPGPAGIWDTNTPASYGDPTPGSWGQHCLLGWSYGGLDDTDLVLLPTWAMLQPCTWRWIKSRLVAVSALVHPQLAGPTGLIGTGVDRDRLAADCAGFAVSA